MAMPEASPPPTPSAQVVGNAFVEQYYHILHQSPNLVHKFYQDSSFVSRPDGNGVMTTVTTMQAINEKILSLNCEDYTAEITTTYAQESYEKGVIVLVTGCLTGKDDVRRKFTQTFFLAPQDTGYYVLNDVFRYIEENDTLQLNSVSVNITIENAEADPAPEAEVIHAPELIVADPATSAEGKNLNHSAEVCDPWENEEEGSVIDEEVAEPSKNLNHNAEVCDPLENEKEGSVIDEEVAEPSTDLSQNNIVTSYDATPAVQNDASRKSYALIVMESNAASGPVYVPSRTIRVASTKPSQQMPATTVKSNPGLGALAPTSDSAPGTSDVHEEAEGYSIYVRNLPFNATAEQLEKVFKKFGTIKHDGIQVRSSKQRFCFGFVEFEELSSMHGALEASPITIGDRQAVIEEKRTTTRVSGSGRGRYPSGRGGSQNDRFRGRGKFGGDQGYGRNEFRNQGDFSGRPKGSSGQKGDSSPRMSHNGRGQGGRQGGVNRNSILSSSA